MAHFNTQQHVYSGLTKLVKPAPAPTKRKGTQKAQINPDLRDAPVPIEAPLPLTPVILSKAEVYSAYKAFIADLYTILLATRDDPKIEREKDARGLSSHGVTNPRMLEDNEPMIPADGIYIDRPFVQFTNLRFNYHDREANDLVIHINVTNWRDGNAFGEVSLATLDKQTQNHVEHVSVLPLQSTFGIAAKTTLCLRTQKDHVHSLRDTVNLIYRTMLHHDINQEKSYLWSHLDRKSLREKMANICTVANCDPTYLIAYSKKKEEERLAQLRALPSSRRQGAAALRKIHSL